VKPPVTDPVAARHETARELRGLAGTVTGPAQVTAAALEHAPEALRAQAVAFRAAAAAFTQAAELLEVQAAAVDQAVTALSTPVHAARWGLSHLAPPGRSSG
jgi:hypothetical protein